MSGPILGLLRHDLRVHLSSSKVGTWKNRTNSLSFFRTVLRKMATGGSSATKQHRNRLANEKSPYLLQHASNPVDWYPWGQEAFEKAKRENKLIFLSVGYSTCHWCHVMERESFENEEIGALMNKHLVSIKVDREERPDVDRVYMTFIQASSGGGGWPMSVWLTPDLKPIVGGTYFPPTDHFGRPGFGTIVQSIANQWRQDPDKMSQQASEILDALQRATVTKAPSDGGALAVDASISTCYRQLARSFEPQYGGFGGAPKFPQPVNFNFMFRHYASKPETSEGKEGLEMCLKTLRFMAKGGMHDHIAQGFHRYSTDEFWHVPHFEKMLYDQGQLTVSYLDAYQITKDEKFSDVARDILKYVSRDLSSKAGGFFSAEDADSYPTDGAEHKKEGAFCVWEEEEIRQLLCDTVEGSDSVSLADVFCKHYDVRKGGNVNFEQDPHGELKQKNVLIVRRSVAVTANSFNLDEASTERALSKARGILYDERLKRPKPHLDDKVLTSWNGLMISGFAKGGQVLGDLAYTTRAVQAASFIKENLFNTQTGCLVRSCYTDEQGEVTQIADPIEGFVDDYSNLIRGLLDLYEASFDQSWLEWASSLQAKQDELFWDADNGGYYGASSKDPSIKLRLKEDQDGAEPSANSVSALNLLRLAQMTGNQEWETRADQLFAVFSDRLTKIPIALPEMVSALVLKHSTPKQIIIRGEPDAADTQALIRCAYSRFLPNKILLLANGNKDSFLYAKLSLLPTLEKLDGKATAYVCENYQCQLPVTSVEELDKLL
ncbi:spermatogenesis-associated protein 20-like [Acanthaster planci]|uniref:Spermatogenesis-associated protein 20-like n=1 Tax=Acanthaster planci TaxID=133434 RepID=A0A8B7YIG6_ACAPL|nr:spermatogenesis-associated protein 20-like [Acanthaster planci]XP_022091415.1 spermatogenesis-associated protein 20-like [Acanthaster planci]XP_022091416.1 spermatogenesis-associated protein 20-like [Acanthaster planci]